MSAAPPISVVLLTLNEEIHVRRALDSVAWCDNVVVVDSFSTDGTEAICRSYENVTFVQNPFVNLAEQRRFATDAGHVRHPWVLAVDADEIVPTELREELVELARRNDPDAPVAYDIAMRIVMWGKWLKHSTGYPHTWRRFFRPDRCRYVQRGHAEKLLVDGAVGRTQHDLVHEDLRGLEDWIAKHNRYSSQEAAFALDELGRVPFSDLLSRDREKRKLARKRLFRGLPFNGALRFFQLYLLRLGFLDGTRGYHLCRLKAHQHYVIRLKMREMRAARAAEKRSD